jgi:hypothetical protein
MYRTLVLWLVLAATPVFGAEVSPPLNWYRGNTHTHTNNSDGNASADSVVRWYKEHGYQFVFITDHEFITDVSGLNAVFAAEERFVVLPGQEITQWGADPARSAAHINSLFTTEVIWPQGERKCRGGGCGATVDASVPLADTFRRNIAQVLANKGIPQINHPNYRWSVRPEDLIDIPEEGCLLEIWNGQRSINNLGGANGSDDTRPAAEGYWDYLLSRGKKVWGVAADDSHDFGESSDRTPSPPGQAWIVVRAPKLNASEIERALRQGNFYASTGVTLADVRRESDSLSITIAESPAPAPRFLTKFIGHGGTVLAEVPGLRPTYRLKGGESYVRAAVVDSNGARAWTQPLFR